MRNMGVAVAWGVAVAGGRIVDFFVGTHDISVNSRRKVMLHWKRALFIFTSSFR